MLNFAGLPMRFITLGSILIFASIARATPPLPTVEFVDLKKYLGTWYEIARFEHRFQKGCTATTATYSMLSNGDIEVINQCHLDHPHGELKKATGVAWVKDKKTNAKLRVQFFLKWMKSRYLSGQYWILSLDKDYQNVLIGDPSREYLWILSRNKTQEDDVYKELKDKAQSLGFDVSKLKRTAH